jgi:hypothetical protein
LEENEEWRFQVDTNFDANVRAASVLLFNNFADGISRCSRVNGCRTDVVAAGKPCPIYDKVAFLPYFKRSLVLF